MTEDFEGRAIIRSISHAELLVGAPGHFIAQGHEPIESLDVASAVNVYGRNPFCSAFRLMQVFEIAVTSDANGSCMHFYQENKDDTVYVFAERLTSHEELRTNPALETEWDKVAAVLPSWAGMPLYLDNQNEVRHVASEEYMNTVLVSRDGNELWRAPEAAKRFSP